MDENLVPTPEEIETFYFMCVFLDEHHDAHHPCAQKELLGRFPLCDFVFKRKSKKYREGIISYRSLYYPGGWVVRSRRKPQWEDIFAARFPDVWMKLVNDGAVDLSIP